MPVPREVTRIDHQLGLAVFEDGASGAIVQWMDREGGFHSERVENALALIVKDPIDGYQTIDLRLMHAATRSPHGALTDIVGVSFSASTSRNGIASRSAWRKKDARSH
jgi:hypothetical protein